MTTAAIQVLIFHQYVSRFLDDMYIDIYALNK